MGRVFCDLVYTPSITYSVNCCPHHVYLHYIHSTSHPGRNQQLPNSDWPPLGQEVNQLWFPCGLLGPNSSNGELFKVPVSSLSFVWDLHAPWHNLLKLSVLLPLIFTILLLLLVAASLLAWRIMKCQQKAAGMSPEQVPQPLEGDLCYADLTQQLTRTSPQKATTKLSFSAQADQVEVEYVAMAPFPKEDISYASLTLAAEDQEPTYCNMGPLSSHIPSGGPEDPTEYSIIRRP
ncbi:CMRF35-like molecule 1 isoform X3 [Macaca fascicularis]|uniref:CMRF35-like molecule 1 isoform X3 n=1 Tax=Macaca fascicularis TaxID=9541 RepID=UPI0032B07ABB